MKRILIFLILLLLNTTLKSQTCDEVMDYVKSKGIGMTYYSPTSEAISKVTFYTIYIDWKAYYYAIVCFKSSYSYSCSEYIYQVSSNTRTYYSMYYTTSAGQAFWTYIYPYRNVLGCGPNLD